MMERRAFPGARSPAQHRRFQERQAESSAEAMLGLAELLLRTKLTPQLGAIGGPTLILSPGSSPFVPTEVACKMPAAVPGAELRVLPHARHGLLLTHGRDGALVLRDFLARHCPPLPEGDHQDA